MTSPSVVYLTNFQSLQSNRLQTVSEWEGLTTKLDKCVGQRPNQMHASINPLLSIVQSTLLDRPKITGLAKIAPTMTHTTSVHTLKMKTLSVISVSKLTKPDSVQPNQLTTWCSRNRCFASQEIPTNF